MIKDILDLARNLFPIPIWLMFLLSLIFGLIFFIEFAVLLSTEDEVVQWEKVCEQGEYSISNKELSLTVECDGTEVVITDQEVLLVSIVNKGQVICTQVIGSTSGQVTNKCIIKQIYYDYPDMFYED